VKVDVVVGHGIHRTLLHEHHNFFLASQHPSVTPALDVLATKYAMPARMWSHGIHSFLELFRVPLSCIARAHVGVHLYLVLHDGPPLYERARRSKTPRSNGLATSDVIGWP
jgi:hypothetical protein